MIEHTLRLIGFSLEQKFGNANKKQIGNAMLSIVMASILGKMRMLIDFKRDREMRRGEVEVTQNVG